MDPLTASLNDLAQQCQEETLKYQRNLPSAPEYCYELMRRAFDSYTGHQAFAHIFRIYSEQVHRWVKQHPRYNATGEDATFFVNGAFAAFYMGVRRNGFDKYPSVMKLLAYLKACVFSAIYDFKSTSDTPLDDETMGHSSEQFGEAKLLYESIKAQLVDSNDQQLFQLRYVLDIKPAEIAELYPDIWEDARAVSVALQRIRRSLRNNEIVRQLLH